MLPEDQAGNHALGAEEIGNVQQPLECLARAQNAVTANHPLAEINP